MKFGGIHHQHQAAESQPNIGMNYSNSDQNFLQNSSHTLHSLSGNMSMLNIDNTGNNALSSTLNSDIGNRQRATHTPVIYRICWSSSTPALTITLLVPKRPDNDPHNNNFANERSPFSKMENNDSINFQSSSDQNSDKYILRISLSYLLSLSTSLSGEEMILSPELDAQQQAATPWLDRPTLRKRLANGGHTIGLEISQLNQAMAAVEESAARLPEWCPVGVECVNAEVILSEDRVTLVADVNIATDASIVGGRQSSPVRQHNAISQNMNSHYNPSPTRSLKHSDNRFGFSGNTNRSSARSMSNINNIPTNRSSGSISNLGRATPTDCNAKSPKHLNAATLDTDETCVSLLATAPAFPPTGASIPTTFPNNGSSGEISSNHIDSEYYTKNDMTANTVAGINCSNHNSYSASIGAGHGMGGLALTQTVPRTLSSGTGLEVNDPSFHYTYQLEPIVSSSSLKSSQVSNDFCSSGSIGFNMDSMNLDENHYMKSHINMFPGANLSTHGASRFNTNYAAGSNAMHVNSREASETSDMLQGSSILGHSQDVTSPVEESSGAISSLDEVTNYANTTEIIRNTMTNEKPDPSSIVDPLLAMGFTRSQCDAAVDAIRNVDSTLSTKFLSMKHQETNILGHSNINENNKNNPQDYEQDIQFGSGLTLNDNNLENSTEIYEEGKDEKEKTNIFNSSKPVHSSGENVLNYMLNNGSNNMQSSSNNLVTGHDITEYIGVNGNVIEDSLLKSIELEGEEKQEVWGLPTSSKLTLSKEQQIIEQQAHQRGTVWENAGKMKLVKTINNVSESSASSAGIALGNSTSSSNSLVGAPVPWGTASTSTNVQQSQKMVKVLDIPSETNAFVFHCNAQTRDECLELGLFGCPSGGQYGPHSKAKTGDLLFLADFSAWTVTGVFTAKTDAGLNLDRSAWGGRFPWQIKLNEWTSPLRTVHIDKVNEILGLASGSKLNMLTKEQLLKLCMSKEFGPCVPAHLYKIKPTTVSQVQASINSSNSLTSMASSPVLNRNSPPPEYSSSSLESKISATAVQVSGLGMNGIKYQQQQLSNTHDEHPATAMHRLKLITAWFDTVTNEILSMNEIYNSKKQSKKDQKEKIVLEDELIKLVKSDTSNFWPLMTYGHVHKAIGDLFDQWLFQTHAIGNEDGRNTRIFHGGGGKTNLGSCSVSTAFDDSGSWTRQGRPGSSSGKKREDPVLLSHIPGAIKHVQQLLQLNDDNHVLAVPTSKMAEVLASKIVKELEQIAGEVRKTQSSLIRIGGDDYFKSVEDKTLGMRLSEVTTKYYDEDGETIEKTVMRIEWHTKSSIAQGRPPQVQKIYKSHFEVLEKKYHDVTCGADPDKIHMLTRMFVLLCRYDLIGDIQNGFRATVPPSAFTSMTEHFGVVHECFASPLNQSCLSYNSVFPDTDRYFGSLGSFFDFVPTEGSFQVNPPFDGESLKMMFDHIFGLLQHSDSDKHALSFLLIISQADEALKFASKSSFLRRSASIENIYINGSSTSRVGIQHKETGPASRKISKNNDDISTPLNSTTSSPSVSLSLVWLQNDFGYDLWTPTDSKVQSVIDGFRNV